MRTNTDPAPLHWKTLDYPLIDLRLDRAACIAIIRQAGLPVPPKSSCWFCPYHSLQTWQHMRQEQPTYSGKQLLWSNDINARRVILGKDRVWCRSKLKPLDQATTDYLQSTLFEEEASCERGYCFV